MGNDVRLLLEGVERRPFFLAGKRVARNRADDDGTELLHEAEGIRALEFVISAGNLRL